MEATAIGANPVDVIGSEEGWPGFVDSRRRRIRCGSWCRFFGHLERQ